ncbi:uncharacterized protein [Coffea arabica]|uniref:Uncharacterized protein n=1 Tax=Coffea arabica TaxID=13443 RepID=A0ABM4UD42_COFAR
MDRLQWGNRKRLRCVKVKDKNNSSSAASTSINGKSDGAVVVKKKITSRFADSCNNNNKEAQPQHNASLPPLPSPHRINNRDLGMSRSNGNENRKASMSLSPEKEDRYYTTRGSVGLDENHKMFVDAKEEKTKFVWPKLLVTLSNKEKEEDFMAMKGCKLPQRPKKRAKLIQKTLLLVSPGTWLSELCQERYEVREKKTSKKKPRGLKAMGSMESDSE